MTTDYTAQAQTIVDGTKARPWVDPPEEVGPGFDFHFGDLNAEIGIPAPTEVDARAKVVDHVADMLRARDPDYVPEPTPSAADHVLDALEALPPGATVDDAIAAVKSSLVDAGATTATVTASKAQ